MEGLPDYGDLVEGLRALSGPRAARRFTRELIEAAPDRELAEMLIGYAFGEFVAEDTCLLSEWTGLKHPAGVRPGMTTQELLELGMASVSDRKLEAVILYAMAARAAGRTGFANDLRLRCSERLIHREGE